MDRFRESISLKGAIGIICFMSSPRIPQTKPMSNKYSIRAIGVGGGGGGVVNSCLYNKSLS